jgi:hypothetical protein
MESCLMEEKARECLALAVKYFDPEVKDAMIWITVPPRPQRLGPQPMAPLGGSGTLGR